jgi:hypothetical protein
MLGSTTTHMRYLLMRVKSPSTNFAKHFVLGKQAGLGSSRPYVTQIGSGSTIEGSGC